MCFNLRNAIRKIPNTVLKGTPKQVLSEICDTIPKGETSCFPSVRCIAENLGLVKRTIQKSLRKLEEDGYIKTEERLRSDGSTASNLYIVDLDKIKFETTYKKEKPAASPVNKGVNDIHGEGEHNSLGAELGSCTGRTSDAPFNDHINDHVNNTPVVPVDGDRSPSQKDKVLPATKNPRHPDYKLTQDEKRDIQTTWNNVAEGRFRTSEVFKTCMERNLRASYKLYKKYQREGHFGDKVRTKVEFAKLLIANFAKSDNWWCDKNNKERNGTFIANLSWLLQAKTFDGMVQ